jgi:hypothetical protein
LAAATEAREIPVFPLVGSTIRVSLSTTPLFSAASIMARAIRSFTLDRGLKNSSFTSTVASPGRVTRFSRTSGVLQIVCTMLQ